MNCIWIILLLLCCSNHSQNRCFEERDRDCDCGTKKECGHKKEYCPDHMHAMPFLRGNEESCCCEKADVE